MRRHYLDTEVWRNGKRGVITNVDHARGEVCVDWGTNKPEWLTRGKVRALRAAKTLADRHEACTCVCTCGARRTPNSHL